MVGASLSAIAHRSDVEQGQVLGGAGLYIPLLQGDQTVLGDTVGDEAPHRDSHVVLDQRGCFLTADEFCHTSSSILSYRTK